MNRPVEWPELGDYRGGVFSDGDQEGYERAMKEAAMQRLRILQRAAIRFMASDIAKKHACYGCVDAIAEALEKVGPLPELPAMGEK